jgi:hypothetical protein
MTLDELVRWRETHRAAITGFQHQHRELAGIHYLDDPAGAHVLFVLKDESGDTPALEAEIGATFPGVAWRIEVLDPDRTWAEFNLEKQG